jgi:hypothetical protein
VAGLTSATRERFASLITEVVAPHLRALGYKKRALTWHRPTSEVWPVVDVQRAWGGEADHTSFTLNWGLYVSEFELQAFEKRRSSPSVVRSAVEGRIGYFADDPQDTWWRIERGQLGRHFPEATQRDADPEHEIAGLLDRMTSFLDRDRDLDQLVGLAEAASAGPTDAPGGARVITLFGGRDPVAILRAIRPTS